MKLVAIVDDEGVAKLLSDPMRRTILNILREKAMNEAQLAKRLGLTDATVNYHLSLLKRAELVFTARKETESHGIVQKFYLPSAYLYLPDVGKLSKGVARYYFPINLERLRGALSSMEPPGMRAADLTASKVDEMGEELARVLVLVAREHLDDETEPGSGEAKVNEIYSKAFSRFIQE